MTPEAKFPPVSALLLAAAGVIVSVIGAYFLFARPPLLREDISFMQLSPAELAAIGPRLELWLTQVFRVLGGFALACGVLTVTLAGTAFRTRNPIAVAGAFVAGAASIGLMAVVNFAIDSNFKWELLGAALVWASSAIAFAAEAGAARLATRTAPGPGPTE